MCSTWGVFYTYVSKSGYIMFHIHVHWLNIFILTNVFRQDFSFQPIYNSLDDVIELWLHCVYVHVCVYITGVACWLDFRESFGFGITLPNLQKFYFHLIDTVLTFILTLSMKAQELLVRRQLPYTCMCNCPCNWKLLAACLLSAHWDFFNKKYDNFFKKNSCILGFMML